MPVIPALLLISACAAEDSNLHSPYGQRCYRPPRLSNFDGYAFTQGDSNPPLPAEVAGALPRETYVQPATLPYLVAPEDQNCTGPDLSAWPLGPSVADGSIDLPLPG